MGKCISREDDQLSKILNPQEVDSLVRNPTWTQGAAWNSLHEHLKRLKGLDPEVQFRKIWESAGLMRRVSVGMRYRTIQDVNNGFGDRTGSCREKTLPRNDSDSEVELWIKSNTEIGTVLEIKTICHPDVYESEILIPSTSGNNTNVWVVMSRSSNRYVDELRHSESENLPAEVAQECVQDQENEHSQGDRSENHIPIHQ